MNIPDSDLPVIREALRLAQRVAEKELEKFNSLLVRLCDDHEIPPEVRASVVANALDRPGFCQHEFTQTYPDREGEPAVTFLLPNCIKCGAERPNLNNCQQCGKFRGHGHECKP